MIEFRLHGERRLAVVTGPEGKKNFKVMDDEGRSYVIHPRQATYEVSGRYRPEAIPAFRAEVAPKLDADSLAVAWEFLHEGGEAVDPAALAELLYSAADPASCYAAHCLLMDDTLYFKQKGEKYEPRSAAQVEELKHQREVTLQRQRDHEAFVTRLRGRMGGEPVAWLEGDAGRLEMVERLVLQGGDAPQAAAAKELLEELGYPGDERGAFQLLGDVGHWQRHENLALRRSGFPVEFSAEALAAVGEAQVRSDPDASRRLDLTAHTLFTIDDHHTREIDDGLSLETLGDGRERLWIHVADPSRMVSPGDALDREACERGTTLYLPTGMLPMFPLELAGGAMSLLEGQDSPALSFGVVLNDDGSVADYTLATTLIRPTRRLTYEDVDASLAGDDDAHPTLERFAYWAGRRHAWRTAQGALTLELPECDIKVDAAGEVSVTPYAVSGARRLVAEMMILASQLAAEYGMAHAIPLPFRAQPRPDLLSEAEREALPDELTRGYAQRSRMPRTVTDLTPAPHHSLGLPAYVQASSPIRRYADLLVHWQLKAHLRGEAPPFDAAALGERLALSGDRSREAMQVERASKRYWAMEYLRRQGQRTWRACFVRWLREDKALGQILLEELALEFPMTFKNPPPIGAQLTVSVSRVDPFADEVRFRLEE